MTVNQIVDLVVRIISVIGYILLAILAIKRKSVVVKTDNNNVENNLEDVVGSVIAEIFSVEDMYNNLFKEGAKAGAFKLRDVLTKAKQLCIEKGLVYDASYWKNIIELVVSAMNNNKSVQSTGQTTVTASAE